MSQIPGLEGDFERGNFSRHLARLRDKNCRLDKSHNRFELAEPSHHVSIT